MRKRVFKTLGNNSFEVEAARLKAYLDRGVSAPGTTDHGGLLGLGDDDHPQYVHISAARTITTKHTFAPGVVQAPFDLGANAQGQVVTGLNADQWDSFHFADYLNQAVRTTDSPSFAHITYAAGLLTLQPTGDIELKPGGNDVLPGTAYLVNLGALTKKYLTLHAAELWVETLVAQNTLATIGGRILVGPTTTLVAAILSTDVTITVKHNQMAIGDYVYMEAGGNVEWMYITAGPTFDEGAYQYSVTRNLDGSGANDWAAGDAVFNTGTTGDGWIDLYSVSGMYDGAGPTIVGNVRTGSLTYSAFSEHFAIGNLNGVYGFSADTYGVGLGQYSGEALTITPVEGIRFLVGTTVYAQLDAEVWTLGRTTLNNVRITATALEFRDGSTVLASLTGTSWVIGQTGLGQENILVSPTAVQFRVQTTVYGELSSNQWVIGLSSAENVLIASGGIQVRLGSTVRFNAATNFVKIGSDTAVVGTTAIAVFNVAQTYNTESVGQYDILFGDNSASKANILWDYSTGTLNFRSGQTANIVINTNGAMEFKFTQEAPNAYIKMTNSDVTTYTSGYGFMNLQKTDSQSRTTGIVTLGYYMNATNTAMLGFEDSNIIFALQTGGTWNYPLEIRGTVAFFSDTVIEMQERATPGAPDAAEVRIFVRNLLGKTQLCALFNTGAVQVIAAQP